MGIVSPLGRSTLSIDERDQLLLRREGETESYVVRKLQDLADATGILDTPGEHLKHVPHAETLSLKRDEWTRAVDAWTQDETAKLVTAARELRAVAPKAKPSDTGMHPDIGVVYSEMRAAWGSESLPAGHPMHIEDLGKFVEFVSLESLLFWGRRHVFGPLVSAGTTMGKASKDSKMLPEVVEEFGLQEYVRPQRSRWSRILDSLRGGSRA